MRAEREFGKASYSCCLRVTPFEAATIKFYETMRRAALAVNGVARRSGCLPSLWRSRNLGPTAHRTGEPPARRASCSNSSPRSRIYSYKAASRRASPSARLSSVVYS